MRRLWVVVLDTAFLLGCGGSSGGGGDVRGPSDTSWDGRADFGVSEVCEPDCEGRLCGPDGCGGSCGSCGAGQFCAVETGRCVADCSDAFEPDDDLAHAVPLEPGVPQDHSLCPPGDRDLLAIALASRADLRIEVTADSGAPVLLELLDGAGQVLDASDADGGGLAVIEWGVLPAGTYEVRVSLEEPEDDLVRYRVHFDASCVPDCDERVCGDDGCGGSCGECGPGFSCGPGGTCVSSCRDVFEPDNTPPQVLTIAPGQGIERTLCPPGDEDWFRIVVATVSHVRIRYDVADGPGVDVHLFSDGHIEEDSDLLVGTGQTVFEDVGPGTHYLMARSEDTDLQVLSYRMVVEFLCAPDCRDRECGADGCGGSCGMCDNGAPCENGICGCAPDCTGMQCGDDGCGGSCGTCPDGFTCDDGTCVCEPRCDGKECGPDGCGGTCGECDAHSTCGSDGRCASTCVDENEPDGEPGLAHLLYPGVPRTHSICPGDDRDWFLFTLASEKDVTVRVTEAAAPVDVVLLRVTLVEEDSTATGPDGSGQAGPDILPAGVYFVRVEASDPDVQVPSYRITLSVSPP